MLLDRQTRLVLAPRADRVRSLEASKRGVTRPARNESDKNLIVSNREGSAKHSVMLAALRRQESRITR